MKITYKNSENAREKRKIAKENARKKQESENARLKAEAEILAAGVCFFWRFCPFFALFWSFFCPFLHFLYEKTLKNSHFCHKKLEII
jgi:uncharacterized membrane protein